MDATTLIRVLMEKRYMEKYRLQAFHPDVRPVIEQAFMAGYPIQMADAEAFASIEAGDIAGYQINQRINELYSGQLLACLYSPIDKDNALDQPSEHALMLLLRSDMLVDRLEEKGTIIAQATLYSNGQEFKYDGRTLLPKKLAEAQMMKGMNFRVNVFNAANCFLFALIVDFRRVPYLTADGIYQTIRAMTKDDTIYEG